MLVIASWGGEGVAIVFEPFHVAGNVDGSSLVASQCLPGVVWVAADRSVEVGDVGVRLRVHHASVIRSECGEIHRALRCATHRPAHFALRSTSILAQYEAARVGAGLAVLPAFVAAQDPSLVPVLPGVARFQRTFWMSMPGDNKHVARMQATWAFLREAVAAQQGLLLPPADGQ